MQNEKAAELTFGNDTVTGEVTVSPEFQRAQTAIELAQKHRERYQAAVTYLKKCVAEHVDEYAQQKSGVPPHRQLVKVVLLTSLFKAGMRKRTVNWLGMRGRAVSYDARHRVVVAAFSRTACERVIKQFEASEKAETDPDVVEATA